MTRRDFALLILIVVVVALTIYVDLDVDHPAWVENLLWWRDDNRDIATQYGLDLQGGLQVLLAADVPEGQEFDSEALETARQIIENRVNSLGLTEPVVQTQGERRIIVELPGVDNPQRAVELIQDTALLEFVDTGNAPLPTDAVIATSLGPPTAGDLTSIPTSTIDLDGEQESVVPGISPAGPFTDTQDYPTYETIITGASLREVGLYTSEFGEFEIRFQLYPEAAQTFASHTATHINQYLCIVLDKRIVSCPIISDEIPNGQGSITLAESTLEEARSLEIKLRYGALPVPLRLEATNTVGPTLGEVSVERSVRAGVIGLSIVLLFMLIYYRLPGGLADIALLIYAALNLAVFRLAPVTLTLPGIAGFLLSAGMAVDANILVFERMKEELRSGRSLERAIDVGFGRAWTSIRDSQISTLIVCFVLYTFGISFGASVVKGFALTLAIGTLTNLFTAVVATRTFVRLVFGLAGDWLEDRRWLLGV